MENGRRADFQELLDRIFIEREVFLRANDKVRYLRFSPRLQQISLVSVFFLLAWLTYSSAGVVFQQDTIDAKNAEIERHKLAYFELLSEVGEYHDQFARLTQNLESNQAHLLALLEDHPDGAVESNSVRDRLSTSDSERARLAIARDALRNRLEEFDSELGLMAARDAELESEVAKMQARLGEFEVEENEVVAAREWLGRRLQDVETQLAQARSESEQLQASLDGVQAELSATEAARSTLTSENGELQQEIDKLGRRLAALDDQKGSLNQTMAQLEDSLEAATQQGEGLIEERDELTGRVAELDARLTEAADRESTLVTTITQLETSLSKAVEQGAQLDAERARLTSSESALQEQLARATMRSGALDNAIGELEEELEQALARGEALETNRDAFKVQVAALQQEIGEADSVKANLERIVGNLKDALTASQEETKRLEAQRRRQDVRISDLQQSLSSASGEQISLAATIGGLRDALEEEQGRGDRLANERTFYEARVATLEERLDDMRDAQQTVINRLTSRTLQSMDAMERTVAMTGVDVDFLLSNVNVDGVGLGQGGPFVPGDYISETDPSYELQASVALLDLQLDRWEALQKLVRRLPLTPPLDHYRLTSGFGTRTDPVNGRKGRHFGVDLAAPMRSPVLSTAPGKVVFAGWRGRFGRMIEIDHGLGIKTRFAHLKKILVKPGQAVGHREKIGLLGSSGRSTGPHVHYEILIDGKPVDPSNFLEAGRNVFKG